MTVDDLSQLMYKCYKFDMPDMTFLQIVVTSCIIFPTLNFFFNYLFCWVGFGLEERDGTLRASAISNINTQCH